MKSVMSHSFSQVPSIEKQRSSFDRSHGHKTTFDAANLVPIYVDEALPGDTFNMNATIFTRLATPIHPIMDNMKMDVHFFSVPVRQLWDNFRKFMGEQTDPGDSIDFTIPQRTLSGGVDEGSFEDYISIPLGYDEAHNALFRRAYIHIFNEWYRDQNLVDSISLDTGDGPDNAVNGMTLLKRGKRHDYFTSCLPWPQKGDAVDLPLGDTAPIDFDATAGTVPPRWERTDGTFASSNVQWGTENHSTPGVIYGVNNDTDIATLAEIAYDPGDTLTVDLSEATGATINSLRQAFQVQKLLERDARGGTRYAEIVSSHFGVNFMDVTYRPEYLGGGSLDININPVTQQSSTDATTPQGNLAAFGTAGRSGMGFTKSFNEHCIIMGIASVRADLTYQQGLNRMFSRETRYDFYWPALANIGEQAVLNKEIYAQGSGGSGADDNVFGYQERYAEYRYKPSIITGKMRSDAADSLDVWHLSQDFATPPSLNQAFIEEDPPIDRVIAVPTEPHFIFDSFFSLRCARPMPLYGVPGNMDRF